MPVSEDFPTIFYTALRFAKLVGEFNIMHKYFSSNSSKTKSEHLGIINIW